MAQPLPRPPRWRPSAADGPRRAQIGQAAAKPSTQGRNGFIEPVTMGSFDRPPVMMRLPDQPHPRERPERPVAPPLCGPLRQGGEIRPALDFGRPRSFPLADAEVLARA